MFPPVKQSSYFHVDNILAPAPAADRKADVFSKNIIYNPDLPKYSTYVVDNRNVSTWLFFLPYNLEHNIMYSII